MDSDTIYTKTQLINEFNTFLNSIFYSFPPLNHSDFINNNIVNCYIGTCKTFITLDSLFIRVTFNDYEMIDYFLSNNDIINNQNLTEVELFNNYVNLFNETIENLLKKDNIDEFYYIEIIPFFKYKNLNNNDYSCNLIIDFINGIPHEFSNYEEYFDKNVIPKDYFKHKNNNEGFIKGTQFTFRLETPKKNIPENVVLLNKIKNNIDYIISDSGDTNLDYIEEVEKLLKMIKDNGILKKND